MSDPIEPISGVNKSSTTAKSQSVSKTESTSKTTETKATSKTSETKAASKTEPTQDNVSISEPEEDDDNDVSPLLKNFTDESQEENAEISGNKSQSRPTNSEAKTNTENKTAQPSTSTENSEESEDAASGDPLGYAADIADEHSKYLEGTVKGLEFLENDKKFPDKGPGIGDKITSLLPQNMQTKKDEITDKLSNGISDMLPDVDPQTKAAISEILPDIKSDSKAFDKISSGLGLAADGASLVNSIKEGDAQSAATDGLSVTKDILEITQGAGETLKNANPSDIGKKVTDLAGAINITKADDLGKAAADLTAKVGSKVGSETGEKVLTTIGKAIPGIDIAVSGISGAHDAIQNAEENGKELSTGEKILVGLGGAVGGIIGDKVGDMAGTAVGAAIGTAICPGIGTVIGGFIGSIAGSILCGDKGAELGGKLMEGLV